jgi:hypothetical protein
MTAGSTPALDKCSLDADRRGEPRIAAAGGPVFRSDNCASRNQTRSSARPALQLITSGRLNALRGCRACAVGEYRAVRRVDHHLLLHDRSGPFPVLHFRLMPDDFPLSDQNGVLLSLCLDLVYDRHIIGPDRRDCRLELRPAISRIAVAAPIIIGDPGLCPGLSPAASRARRRFDIGGGFLGFPCALLLRTVVAANPHYALRISIGCT